MASAPGMSTPAPPGGTVHAPDAFRNLLLAASPLAGAGTSPCVPPLPLSPVKSAEPAGVSHAPSPRRKCSWFPSSFLSSPCAVVDALPFSSSAQSANWSMRTVGSLL